MQQIPSDIQNSIFNDIASHAEWCEEVQRGKMFGALVVEGDDALVHTMKDGTKVLYAYSGQILGRSDWQGYVPAIFDYLQPDGYFKQHESEITKINKRVREAEALLPKGKRSAEVERMKLERKERSNALQRWLFSQFMLKGCDGTSATVLDVFTRYAQRNSLKQILPPGGTGECCAPKLLHYANSRNLKPLQLYEFWYGDSPKGEVRHHGMCYEPCQAKCQPILWYLNPLQPKLEDFGPESTELKVIYEDEWLVAIDKPAHLLSVPGKRKLPNAEENLKEQLGVPYLKMVHRLDMDTSGVLLAAKDPDTFVMMQRLFANHENVQKEYVAIVCANEVVANGALMQHNPVEISQEGIVNLPLNADFLNRPRQMVDYENGKEAITEWTLLRADKSRRLLLLKPLTGRTHQLRMHCAHQEGLNMPILGDPLYGNVQAERMFLHASKLSFIHPVTNKETVIESPVDNEFSQLDY